MERQLKRFLIAVPVGLVLASVLAGGCNKQPGEPGMDPNVKPNPTAVAAMQTTPRPRPPGLRMPPGENKESR